MRNVMLALGTFGLVISTPAVAGKKKQLSGLELQQLQARDFEAPTGISFPAVMTVLQDAGYRIGSADKDTGLITGSASTKANLTWMPFVGFGRSKKTPVVSAFIEERGAGSRIRLNFVLSKAKSNIYGSGLSDEEPIIDAAIYKSAFEKIEKEIFIRQALNAPKPVVAVPAALPTAESPANAPAAPVAAASGQAGSATPASN